MTVPSPHVTEKYIRTPIVVHVGRLGVFGTVVRGAVSGFEVIGIVSRVATGMFLEALCARPLLLLGSARISDKVHKLERVRVRFPVRGPGPAIVREGRGVRDGTVAVARKVFADHLEENIGEDAATVVLKVKPGRDIAETAVVVRSDRVVAKI